MVNGIHGDIDLTQNLDFYRQKPLPKLPDNVSLKSKEEQKELDKVSVKLKPNFTTTVNSTNSLTITYSYNYESYSTNIYNSYGSWDNDYNYLSDMDGYSNTNSISSYYTIYYSDNNDGYTTIISGTKPLIELEEPKDEEETEDQYIKRTLSNFKLWRVGERKQKEVEACSYKCIGCGKTFIKDYTDNSSISLGFKRCPECEEEYFYKKPKLPFAIKDEEDYGYQIPWDNDQESREFFYQVYHHGRQSDNDMYKKLARLIPWIKSGRYFEDYIDELLDQEKDYSKYLTDLSWIGISQRVRSDEDEIIDIQHVYTDEDLII